MTIESSRFDAALRTHQAGELATALRLYQRLLIEQPDHADVQHLIGIVAHQRGAPHSALPAIQRALRLNATVAAYHSNLGNALTMLEAFDPAAVACRTALCLRPDSAEANSNLGNALNGQKRHVQAVIAYGRAIKLRQDYPEAWTNQSVALMRQNLAYDAHSAARRSLVVAPGWVEGLNSLGLVSRDLSQTDLATLWWVRALRVRPDHVEAIANLGNALADMGQPDQAIAGHRLAIAIKPDFADPYANLHDLLLGKDDADAAMTGCSRALRIAPDLAEARINLGILQRNCGLPEQAIASFRDAIATNPDLVEAHTNLGVALRERGALEAAILAFRTAISVRPDHAEAHYYLGNMLLQQGALAQGWRRYEWRWLTTGHGFVPRHEDQKRWRGEDPAGKTILLHSEQGHGDTIQMVRYVPLLAARGARVILEVHPLQLGLFRSLAGISAIIARGQTLPSFDLQCPLMSLPGAFNTDMHSIPAPVPYLSAEPGRVEQWRRCLPPSRLRIGIAWQGSPIYKEDAARSAPLACFAPLARLPGVSLISLQKRHGLDQLETLPENMNVITLGPDFDEGASAFLDSAAVMMSLDLIITVDTAVGHLAGALGRPVWLALPSVAHWVWMLDRDETPWYPHTRLFRQRGAGEWQEVFTRMAVRLQAILAGTDGERLDDGASQHSRP